MMKRYYVVIIVVVLLSRIVQAQVPDKEKVIAGAEKVVSQAAASVTNPAPGCAVGVSLNGQSVFEKAFGLAEVEHNIPNTPATIFESGSVAKQFTAAAIVLLAQEGKLSLDDPVRKYIPELPDYGAPLTIRQILNHTAGLRDWGTVLELTGAGRGDRVISQDLALDVIVHQKALDFTPGSEYSYSNSGYTLAAAIVERVSKQKLPEFTAERFFKPLGMSHTSWRDDYQRVVPGRAQAYSRQGGEPWRLNMPFMNVYGNGGMLTNVGDWLKWNAMLESGSMGAPLVEELEKTVPLSDGRKINYALGLIANDYYGVREISHGGATAGYQTYLARYPEKKVSIAVLCNGTAPGAAALTRRIADEIFGILPPPAKSAEMTADELQKYTGLWRNEKTHQPASITGENGQLRLNGTVLSASGSGFRMGSGTINFTMGSNGKAASFEIASGNVLEKFIVEKEWVPTKAELDAFAGQWFSDEAGAGFSFVVEGDKSFLVQRPATRLLLKPLYKDHFSASGFVIWFTGNGNGKADILHIGTSRMRDMPFVRSKI
jgi:CubicO group peptidase (beta-lactamase class C family)